MAEVQRARAERIGTKRPATVNGPPRAKRPRRNKSAPAAPSEEQGENDDQDPRETANLTTDEAQRSTQRLAAWIHACGAALAEKMHGPEGLAEHDGTIEFTQDPDWETHQRCEINTRLDGVSRGLVFEARDDPDEVRLQKAWATRVLLNKRGMLAKIEALYAAKAGRGLYEGGVDEQVLSDALDKAGRLDNAYAGMRRNQWQGESNARGQKGRYQQRPLFASTWARLRREGAFANALGELAREVPLATVLSHTLRVHSDFVAMVLARDLAVLLPSLVSQADVDSVVVIGGGALSTFEACAAATGKSNKERLAELHSRLLELLDPALLLLVVPQGWTKDLTEHACCELRRWDEARKHRPRNAKGKEQRQKQRIEELRATWQLLGFAAPPRLVA